MFGFMARHQFVTAALVFLWAEAKFVWEHNT
jgi:hypothetical protein